MAAERESFVKGRNGHKSQNNKTHKRHHDCHDDSSNSTKTEDEQQGEKRPFFPSYQLGRASLLCMMLIPIKIR